jgi:hypothetical protein
MQITSSRIRRLLKDIHTLIHMMKTLHVDIAVSYEKHTLLILINFAGADEHAINFIFFFYYTIRFDSIYA